MGIETILISAGMSAATAGTVATGLNVLSGVSSLVGGLQGLSGGNAQAENAKAQAALAGQEQARQASREAEFERRNVADATRKQKLAYLSSGVSLAGTPFLALNETKRRGAENIDEIIRSGASGVAARAQEGRTAAAQLKSAGRREFISGLSNAATSFGRIG